MYRPASPADVAGGLSAAMVHIWSVPLSGRATPIPFLHWLSPAEHYRIRRLRERRSYERMIRARGALRYILGAYVGSPIAAALWPTGGNGKPRLPPGAPANLQINLSHGSDFALVGVSNAGAIGVDIEAPRRVSQLPAIARRYFSNVERAWLADAGDDAERARRFLRIWTLKESMVKAAGMSVARDMARFSIAPDNMTLHVVPAQLPAANCWNIDCLSPQSGQMAAAAVIGKVTRWEHFELSNPR